MNFRKLQTLIFIISALVLCFVVITTVHANSNSGHKLITSSNSGPLLTDTTGPTDIPTPSPTSPPKDVNGFPMDYQSVSVEDLSIKPSAYIARQVLFTCTIIGFYRGFNGDLTQFNCEDPNDANYILSAASIHFDFTKINKFDTVTVYGTGLGVASGQNIYGGPVSETEITAWDIIDTTSGYRYFYTRSTWNTTTLSNNE